MKGLFVSALLLLTFTFMGKSFGCAVENEGCGGPEQTKCCMGQYITCVYEVADVPEARGTCQKTCSVEGATCGGYTPDPKMCCGGLSCVMTNPRIPDLPGRCQLKNSTHY